MKTRGRRAAALLATGVVALAAAAAGYAYWTSTGSGSAEAATDTNGPWSFEVSGPTGGPLAPDGPSQSFLYTVQNDGTGSQALSSVTVSVANANGSTWTSGDCSAADFSLNGGAAGDPLVDTRLAQVFGAGGSDSATVYVQMVDTGVNQDDCQGVTVPLYFSAS
jgi:hypothetical protein